MYQNGVPLARAQKNPLPGTSISVMTTETPFSNNVFVAKSAWGIVGLSLISWTYRAEVCIIIIRKPEIESFGVFPQIPTIEVLVV